jgi:serine/threonine-protein kinase 24/25/MST4
MFETWLVLEWCDRGSLAEFITTKKLPPAGSDPQQREAWILLCLLDIALGLNYLHSSGIVSAELG